eukprot:3241620-Pleurochrysis_carterae.AAC.1
MRLDVVHIPWRCAVMKQLTLSARDDAAARRRVKLMQDVLSGSTAIKVNVWEDAIGGRVRALRAREASSIAHSLTLLAALEAFIFFAPGFAAFLALTADHYVSGLGDGEVKVRACAYAFCGCAFACERPACAWMVRTRARAN